MTPEQTLLLSSVVIAAAVTLFFLWVGPVWDGIARKQVADLTPSMRELSLDTSRLPTFLRWWGTVMVGTFFLLGFLAGTPLLAPFFVYLIYVAPRLILEARIARRRRLLRDQMVGAAVTLANACRAGLSFAQGLESLAMESPEPIAAEFRRLIREYQRGRPLAEALRDAKDRLNLDGFTLFASAILTCLERGGKITDALDRISRSLQENQRLERKLDADTASGRKVVIILGAFPVVFLLGFLALDPAQGKLLFSTILGQIILLVIGVMVYASVRWAQRILSLNI